MGKKGIINIPLGTNYPGWLTFYLQLNRNEKINSTSSQLSYSVLLAQSAIDIYEEGRNVIRSKFVSAYNVVPTPKAYSICSFSEPFSHWSHSESLTETESGKLICDRRATFNSFLLISQPCRLASHG